MSDSKNTMNAFMAYAPMWGRPEDKDAFNKQWKKFNAGMEAFCGQMQEIQETAIEVQKEAWNKLFPKFMEMEDRIVSSLPEKLPTLPGMPEIPVNPKEIMGKVKEFQETANKNAVERVDSMIGFWKQSQEQVKKAFAETVKSIEEKKN